MDTPQPRQSRDTTSPGASTETLPSASPPANASEEQRALLEAEKFGLKFRVSTPIENFEL